MKLTTLFASVLALTQFKSFAPFVSAANGQAYFRFCNLYPQPVDFKIAIQLWTDSISNAYTEGVPFGACATTSSAALIISGNPGESIHVNVTANYGGGVADAPVGTWQAADFTLQQYDAQNIILAIACKDGPTNICIDFPSGSLQQQQASLATGAARFLIANYAPRLNSSVHVVIDNDKPSQALGFQENYETDLFSGSSETRTISFVQSGQSDFTLNSAIASATIKADFVPGFAQLHFAAVIGLGGLVVNKYTSPYSVFLLGPEHSPQNGLTTSVLFCNFFERYKTQTLTVNGVRSSAVSFKQCDTISNIPVPDIQQPNQPVPVILSPLGRPNISQVYPLHYQSQQNLIFAVNQQANGLDLAFAFPQAVEDLGIRSTIQSDEYRVFYLNHAAWGGSSVPAVDFYDDSTGSLQPIAVAQNVAFAQATQGLSYGSSVATYQNVAVYTRQLQIQARRHGTGEVIDTVTIQQSELPTSGSCIVFALVGTDNNGGVKLFYTTTKTLSTVSNAAPISSSSTGSAAALYFSSTASNNQYTVSSTAASAISSTASVKSSSSTGTLVVRPATGNETSSTTSTTIGATITVAIVSMAAILSA